MENYYLFALSAICLLIMPGPDTALALTNTLSYGKKGGFKTVLGILCALAVHILAAVIGLSSLIAHSIFLFSAIKFLGALYLIYIGVKSLLSLIKKSDTVSDLPPKNKACFRQGLLSNLLNPKVILFFLSFLPQFIHTDGNTMIQFLTLGGIHLFLTISYYTLYISVINRFGNQINPIAFRTISSVTGMVLILFGIKLAFFH